MSKSIKSQNPDNRITEKSINKSQNSNEGNVTANQWQRLREFTDARIALGRAGVSLPTRELLAFQLAHAQAQDAVHLPLDAEKLKAELIHYFDSKRPACVTASLPIIIHSAAQNRLEYLQRPDLGRKLSDTARDQLVECRCGRDEDMGCSGNTSSPYDLAIVIVDGLSSHAVQNNALPMLKALLPLLDAHSEQWCLAPFTIVKQGRVAIGDHIGHCLNARVVLVMIGERPGLSSPDSLGLYLTWAPQPGRTDAERNCISNVRPAGLQYSNAASRLLYLLSEARKRCLTGVKLKDRTDDGKIVHANGTKNFLLSV